MKKLLISVLIITMFFTVMCCSVRADATTIEVGTQQEWFDALAQIHASSNETFIISVTQDITIDDSTLFTSGSKSTITINNGNTVTVLGNGHTLNFGLSQYDKLTVSGGTLNLGLSDGSNTLTIKGPGAGNASYDSLVSVSNGTVNMYDGVILSDNCSSYSSLAAGGVRVNADGVFNMYGGTIKDNKIETSEVGGAVVADGDRSTFNMYGGTIENNQSVKWGGGITTNSTTSKLKITGGTIKNNRAVYGGGILTGDGTATITNVIIKENNATVGGGILNYASLTVSNSQIINNTAVRAGGIANRDDGDDETNVVLTLSNNIIKNNTCTEKGGGIYSEIPIISSGDVITENQAKDGGGVYLVSGEADLSTAKVYNNKATNSGNDYVITSNVTSIKIIDAGDIDEEAQIGGETIPVNMWHKDEKDNRFSLTNETDIVQASEITAGTAYYLVAANGGCKVYFDDDGEQSTANAKKTFVKGRKIKLNANGGVVTSDEIDLTSDSVTIENPTRTGYKFTGWTEEDVEGYDLGLKANWEAETEEEPTSDDENKTSDDEEESPAEAEEEESQEESPKSTKGVSTGDTIVKWISALGLATLVFSLTTIKLKNSKLKGKRFK